jgi:hypothetical protein
VQSNPETALREATDALDYFESTGEESMARGLRVDLSLIEMEAGSLDRARALTQSCLDQLDDNSSMYSRLCLYLNMSMIESLLGNDRSAARYCSQSIRVVNDHAVLGSQSGTLVTEAVVLVGLGFDEDAARVHGTCSAMIERGHGALDRFERRIDERSVDRLRERLGEEVVLQLEAEGRTWSFEQASARTDEALVAFLGAGSA